MDSLIKLLESFSRSAGTLSFLLTLILAVAGWYKFYAQGKKARAREGEIIDLKRKRDEMQKRLDFMLDDREVSHPVDFTKQLALYREEGETDKAQILATQYIKNQTDAMAKATLMLAEQTMMGMAEDRDATLAQTAHWLEIGVGFAPDDKNLRAMQMELEYLQSEAGKEESVDFRIDPKLTVAQLTKIGSELLSKARYAPAKLYLERARLRALIENGRTTRTFATATNNLAELLKALGRYEEAESLYRQAIEIDKKTLGEEHPGYAISLNNLAGLLMDKGQLGAAEPLYRQAMRITKKTLGEEHPEHATHLCNLAGLLKDKGQMGAAEPLFRQAMEITKKALGEEHPDHATMLNNLAGLLKATGRFEEAGPMYQQMIAIREASLGVEHPNTILGKQNYELFLAAREVADKSDS